MEEQAVILKVIMRQRLRITEFVDEIKEGEGEKEIGEKNETYFQNCGQAKVLNSAMKSGWQTLLNMTKDSKIYLSPKGNKNDC